MNLSGQPIDFLKAFLGGVLISFTPCVYPLVPIIVGYIGASSANSKIKGFLLSLIYVTGISLTYALLGLAAALTGQLFGRFSSQPFVRIIAGSIIILFGLVLLIKGGFGAPVLNLPRSKKSGEYLSNFVLGITSGFLVGPCTAPVLASILVFVATERNLLYGASLLFVFAYGMGLLLILAGTFSGILINLPKSGYWMERIKKLCAVILIALGIYFIFLGATSFAYPRYKDIETLNLDFRLKDLGENEISLSEYKNKKSIVLFFWTTWCPFCLRELDSLNRTYPRLKSEGIEVLAIDIQESAQRVRGFVQRKLLTFPVLLDLDGSVAEAYGLVGVPTFVLINKAGRIVFMDNYFPREDYSSLLSSHEK